MDIAALSSALSQQRLMSDFSVAIMSKTLDTAENTGDTLTKMMEQSVQPNLGQNIDVTV